LDSDGRPCIIYASASKGLNYACYDGAAWIIETVDTLGGWDNSLALDSANHPHISYHDWHSGRLQYAHHDGVGWVTETVDSIGKTAAELWSTSIAVDSSDRPHIAYYDPHSSDLKYAHYDGTTWTTETVDSKGDVGLYTSLALDASDRPHISYLSAVYDTGWSPPENIELRYAHYDGTTWITETVDSSGYTGLHSSLALDASDWPHIAYSVERLSRSKIGL
jgi:hypothetical protein